MNYDHDLILARQQSRTNPSSPSIPDPLAIKRTIIDAWISDFPPTPPTPESPGGRWRKHSRKLWDTMAEEGSEPPRRSKRISSLPKHIQPQEPSTHNKVSPSPIKKQTPARGRGGKIPQLRPRLGIHTQPAAAAN